MENKTDMEKQENQQQQTNPAKLVPDKESFTDAKKYVESFQQQTSAVRGTYKFALIVAAVIAIASVVYSLWKTSTESDLVYIVNDESARLAKRADNSLTRDQEVVLHVTRFHEKFYNLSPNLETIQESINSALSLADRSAALIHNRREEQRFYSNLVDSRIVEEIYIDSIRVNTAIYPYEAYSYGRLTIIRETRKFDYAFESSCNLVNVARSSSNMNGLLIQKYKEEKRELIR